eukprot:c20886_g1_i1 orf=88-288(+)
MFLGVGGAIDVGAKAGVHILGVDFDEHAIDWVLKNKGKLHQHRSSTSTTNLIDVPEFGPPIDEIDF